MSIKLSADVEALIAAKVESGEYPDADTVVRAALLQLDYSMDLAGWDRESLDREIQRGLDDIKAGRVCDGPSYFRELEEELDREEQAQGK
ncbi:MAG TPA: hypothetical protein DCL48_10820 [Alphaproteobacteria bacterium]|nr:hypothetical protein [Alphaproteobacteria bacterium]